MRSCKLQLFPNNEEGVSMCLDEDNWGHEYNCVLFCFLKYSALNFLQVKKKNTLFLEL